MKLPKLPKVSTRHLIIAGTSLIVLVAVVVSLATYQKHQQTVAHNAAVAREVSIKAENDRKAKDRAKAAEITNLQTAVTNLTADKAVLCKATVVRTTKTAAHCQ